MYFRGQVVKSVAGRDKGYLMTVTDCDGAYVYVCDGKERRLSGPKRKNPKHIEIIPVVLNESQMRSDRGLRKALAQIETNNE